MGKMLYIKVIFVVEWNYSKDERCDELQVNKTNDPDFVLSFGKDNHIE